MDATPSPSPAELGFVEVDATTFDREVRDVRDALVLVYMWGPNCPNCVVFKHALPQIRAQLVGLPVRFVAVDVYTHGDVGLAHGLYGVPAFALYRDGKKLGLMRQFHGVDYFVAVIREHLPGASAARA